MGIKPRFTVQDIKKALNKDLQNIENGILRIMKRAGDKFVTDARLKVNISGAFPKGKYRDRTANLRNSIGYFILIDNEVVLESGGGSIGHMAARATLKKLPPKSGYRLVGVAGMEYASYLESKGYNVITSQQEVLFVNLSKWLREFSKQLSDEGFDMDFDSNF